MIYRFHVFEETNKNRVRTSYSDNALRSILERLPEQLNWLLQEAEVLTEILDLDKLESYLKITTNLEKQSLITAINQKLSLNGLGSTLISK